MSGQFKAYEISQKDPLTIGVVGDIDAHSVVQAREEGEVLLRSMGKQVKVDLVGLGHGGSVVMSMLLCWIRLANSLSVTLFIENSPRDFAELCRVNGLDRILANPQNQK